MQSTSTPFPPLRSIPVTRTGKYYYSLKSKEDEDDDKVYTLSQVLFFVNLLLYTGNFWWGKIGELSAIRLTNVHRYAENVFGTCTDCSSFTKCFLTNSFYLYGSPKFSLAQIFPCTVL